MWIWHDNRYTCLLVSVFLSYWISPCSGIVFLFMASPFEIIRMVTLFFFIASLFVFYHLTLYYWTFHSPSVLHNIMSRLTVLLLVTGECGGWDVIGWGPYGKHSWYLLWSLLLGNFWESSSTKGKKTFPFLFSFFHKYFFSSCLLYSLYNIIKKMLKYIEGLFSFNTQCYETMLLKCFWIIYRSKITSRQLWHVSKGFSKKEIIFFSCLPPQNMSFFLLLI